VVVYGSGMVSTDQYLLSNKHLQQQTQGAAKNLGLSPRVHFHNKTMNNHTKYCPETRGFWASLKEYFLQ
jgi:hypothetical protein